jgi:hypothetical protein
MHTLHAAGALWKDTPFLIFPSMSFPLFPGHTVQSLQIWPCAVISPSCHSLMEWRRRNIARLQIVQNEYKPLSTSPVRKLLLQLPRPMTSSLLLLRSHQHVDCQTVRLIALLLLV